MQQNTSLRKQIPRSRGSVDNFSDFPPMMPGLPETLLAEGKFNKVLKIIFMFSIIKIASVSGIDIIVFGIGIDVINTISFVYISA